MLALVVIPARYSSTRFPGKPLYPLNGKPVIQHVYERVREARRADGVFVATDDERIFCAVESFGGKALMTSTEHRSGTDRIAEAVRILEERGVWQGGGVIVNVQGDEPLIRPEMVDALIGLMDDERAQIGTLAKRIERWEEISDPNTVKVVFNCEGFALYFSRSPIPYHRDLFLERREGTRMTESRFMAIFKHTGIYAFRRDVLMSFAGWSPSRLEEIERLEQLRALERGVAIKVGETLFDTLGVDTPEDAIRVEQCLSASS